MYKEINVNKVMHKTLTTTNLNSKSMKFIFKSKDDKAGQTAYSNPLARLGLPRNSHGPSARWDGLTRITRIT